MQFKTKQKDHTTLDLKCSLRRNLLEYIETPVVMETHGGQGEIFKRCYKDFTRGVVFEKNKEKAYYLARQRPTWSVYECDCLVALKYSVGKHLPVNFLDLDPYGQPWPIIERFFSGKYGFQPRMALAVNDGLRLRLRVSGSHRVDSLKKIELKYGSDVIHDNYLAICKELVAEKVALAGYKIKQWAGYYTGNAKQMSHYGAILEK